MGANGKYRSEQLFYMTSDVLAAVQVSMLAFWVVTPSGFVCRYHCFGSIYYYHLQGWPAFFLFGRVSQLVSRSVRWTLIRSINIFVLKNAYDMQLLVAA